MNEPEGKPIGADEFRRLSAAAVSSSIMAATAIWRRWQLGGIIMPWRRERATLDDVVELLQGSGTILMKIDAKLQEIIQHLEEDDDDEAES